MNNKNKSKILSVITFFILFIIIWTLLNLTFNDLHGALKAIISGVLTPIFAPRVNIIEKQSGTKTQLVWFLFKTPISF
jgi:hypothetical protein